MTPFTPDYGNMPPHIVGREREQSAIGDELELLTNSRGPRPILMIGPRGRGKSPILLLIISGIPGAIEVLRTFGATFFDWAKELDIGSLAKILWLTQERLKRNCLTSVDLLQAVGSIVENQKNKHGRSGGFNQANLSHGLSLDTLGKHTPRLRPTKLHSTRPAMRRNSVNAEGVSQCFTRLTIR